MAYPDDVLAQGEELVLHRHPHWRMLVVPVLVLVGVVALVGFLAAVVRNQTWAGTAWIMLALVGAGLVLWFTGGPVLRWRTTHFVITDRRVLVREGLFTRTGIDIPMTRINSVQFRHGIVDRVLGTGTLIIESASDEPLEFDDVPQVERVHAMLHDIMLHDRVFDGSAAASSAPDGLPPDHAAVSESPWRRARGWRG